LRLTFNEDALLYDRVRPGYPTAMLDDIVALSGIPAGGRILEIGPGTGQVTLPWARRGYRVVAVELGTNMAAVARDRLAAFANVEIHVGAFEDWPVESGAFDLVFSATAFHWIDPLVRYHKAAQALKAGGAIALCWNKHVQSPASRGFFEAVQPFYKRAFPNEVHEELLLPEAVVATEKEEIEQSGLFGDVIVRKYVWDQAYDSASYIDVLNTYSGHRSLPLDQRQRLFDSITEVIETQYGGRIVKGYLTLLCSALRLRDEMERR
jgi:SAM-dependent methyltransferase